MVQVSKGYRTHGKVHVHSHTTPVSLAVIISLPLQANVRQDADTHMCIEDLFSLKSRDLSTGTDVSTCM